jgi:predicted Zn-dependent protease
MIASTFKGPEPHSRFLSQAECEALVRRARSFAVDGGNTTVDLDTSWTGNIRWGRNKISTAGDVRDNVLSLTRWVRGASGSFQTNQIDDTHLHDTVRRAERMVGFRREEPEWERTDPFRETYLTPHIWSDATYTLDAGARAALVTQLLAPIRNAGMVAAGYLQVAAHARLSMDESRVWYYPYTVTQFSITVRDPEGTGSGWAGVDGNDWSRIDPQALAAVALDKCVRSRNPVTVEPGRYTTILEPQAVADFVNICFTPGTLDREAVEAIGRAGPAADPVNDDPFQGSRQGTVYADGHGNSRIGHRVIDPRITVSVDPTDPDLGFPPFFGWTVFRPTTWIEQGVLKELAYSREYAVKRLHLNTGGLHTTGSYKLVGHGPDTGVSIDAMIASTKRGLLVTRFYGIPPVPIDERSMMLVGYTRDGTWLIENGKISKPVKNFRFTESPVLALNNVEQIGTPRRVFRPFGPRPYDRTPGLSPVMVPALKIRDFNFTSLSDAV